MGVAGRWVAVRNAGYEVFLMTRKPTSDDTPGDPCASTEPRPWPDPIRLAPRAGWAEAAKLGRSPRLDVEIPTRFEEEEWNW